MAFTISDIVQLIALLTAIADLVISILSFRKK